MKYKKEILIIICIFLVTVSLVTNLIFVREKQEIRKEALANRQTVLSTEEDVSEDEVEEEEFEETGEEEEEEEGDLEEIEEEEDEDDESEEVDDEEGEDLDCDFTCTDLYVVGDDGNITPINQLQELEPQEICFEVKGWTNCDQGITQARFQLIGWDDWELGEYHRDEAGEDDYGRNYYYRWCHDFEEIEETSCSDIEAEVCVGEVCR